MTYRYRVVAWWGDVPEPIKQGATLIYAHDRGPESQQDIIDVHTGGSIGGWWMESEADPYANCPDYHKHGACNCSTGLLGACVVAREGLRLGED